MHGYRNVLATQAGRVAEKMMRAKYSFVCSLVLLVSIACGERHGDGSVTASEQPLRKAGLTRRVTYIADHVKIQALLKGFTNVASAMQRATASTNAKGGASAAAGSFDGIYSAMRAKPLIQQSFAIGHTNCEEAIGKHAEFFDRHPVECGQSWVLNSFALTGGCSHNKMRYKTKCIGTSVSAAVTHYTSCGDVKGKHVDFLEHHPMACGRNEALTSMKLTRRGCSGGKQRYEFKCRTIHACSVVGATHQGLERKGAVNELTHSAALLGAGPTHAKMGATKNGRAIGKKLQAVIAQLVSEAVADKCRAGGQGKNKSACKPRKGEEITKRTKCSPMRHKTLEYLDRQSVECGNKQALNAVKVISTGCSGDNLRFEYKCLTVKPEMQAWTNQAAPDIHYWSLSAKDTGKFWLKVTFPRRVPSITYMGLLTRECPCERWSEARVETEHESVVATLSIKDRYSINHVKLDARATRWVRFTPTATASRHAPGAVELEFWSPSTTHDAGVCEANPFLLSSVRSKSPVCKHGWNNFIVSEVKAAKGKRINLQIYPTNKIFGVANKLKAEKTVVIKTAGWSGSFLGFKNYNYPVRATPLGDCRAGIQGKTIDENEWAAPHHLLEKRCAIIKWTACNVGKCSVKKRCTVEGMSTLVKDIKGKLGQSIWRRQLPKAFYGGHQINKCLMESCESQCAMA